MNAPSPRDQVTRLARGTAEIISEDALLAKLQQRRPLRVKLGLDPTAPDIHLGNAIVLQKLRQFQDLGHEAILVIGDFTGLIGDPSGRSETRPQLTREAIQRNAATYRDQYGRILDPNRTRVVFNSEWLAPMRFEDVIRLAGRATVHRLLERDDFAKRYREHLPIHVHELLYPLCQAYDSVAIQADVELGGTDQKFNNLMGRELQREMGQEPQVVVLTPLLPGLDGVQKMSKSLGNAIGITEPPNEMYGKVMSLADALMIPYFEYCTLVPLDEVRALEAGLKTSAVHPRDVKRRLAREITARYHGEAEAGAAESEFDRVFKARQIPADISEITLRREKLRRERKLLPDDSVRLDYLLVELSACVPGFPKTNSEARRLIDQNGVRINDVSIAEQRSRGSGLVEQVDNTIFVRLPDDAQRESVGRASGLRINVGRRHFVRVWLAGA